MHAYEKRGAKLHLWSSFCNACMFTFRTPPTTRCWNARPLVGATQYPRSPFPLLLAISVAGPREFQTPVYGHSIRPYFAIFSRVPPACIASIISMTVSSHSHIRHLLIVRQIFFSFTTYTISASLLFLLTLS